MFFSEQACLLSKTDYGEHHILQVYFLSGKGLKSALARRRPKPGTDPQLPDLFECGEIVLQQSDDSKPAFLKDFTSTKRFPGIARKYSKLQAASSLSRFYERNLIHMELFSNAWELLLKALTALSEKDHPEAVLFKTLFLFASLEGYPVRQQWLERQPPDYRQRVLRVLKTPVETCPEDGDSLKQWIEALFRYFQQETDLIPPDL